ncbi:MAG: hypothetical protein ACLS4R_13845, partial [Roseburia inulinivorans]
YAESNNFKFGELRKSKFVRNRNFEFWEVMTMKKILILLLCLLLTASITGCGTQSIKPIDTIEGNMKTYSEMSDGTWQCDGHIYKYRLEISGRLSNAVKDSTYIYLSNIEDITFEQAWKASGLSSNMDDYFDIDEAVLVELPD